MAIADNVILGESVRIFHPHLVNIYGCTLGTETTVGPFVEIQSGVSIGSRVKVSSHTFICSGVRIDEWCVYWAWSYVYERYLPACNE